MAQNDAQNVPRGTNGKGRSNTEAKQRSLANLKPFKKGDERINRNGRPKSFDQLRTLAQSIAHAEVQNKEGDTITVADEILRQWASSTDVQKQKAFIEYAFGKVPDKIESTGLESKTTLVLHWPHERTDLTAAPLNGTTNGRS